MYQTKIFQVGAAVHRPDADQYRRILENTKVNDKFRSEYLKQYYNPAEITEEEIRKAVRKQP